MLKKFIKQEKESLTKRPKTIEKEFYEILALFQNK